MKQGLSHHVVNIYVTKYDKFNYPNMWHMTKFWKYYWCMKQKLLPKLIMVEVVVSEIFLFALQRIMMKV